KAVPGYWWLVPMVSIFSLYVAWRLFKWMRAEEEGTDLMKEIAGHVREGAMAYLNAQYRAVGIVFAVLFGIFFVLALMGVQNPFVPVAFLTGGLFSGICGYIGMQTAPLASSRTA